MISAARLEQLRKLISAGKENQFYWWREWRGSQTKKGVRAQVLELDNFECQTCKAAGRYSPGYIVHHVKPLRERPDLALSITDPDTGRRQLLTVCKSCHEAEHPESLPKITRKSPPLTVEFWD